MSPFAGIQAFLKCIQQDTNTIRMLHMSPARVHAFLLLYHFPVCPKKEPQFVVCTVGLHKLLTRANLRMCLQPELHGFVPTKDGAFEDLQQDPVHWSNSLKQCAAMCNSLNLINRQ